MSTDYLGARNAIFKKINDAWQLNTAAVIGYVPKIYWQWNQETERPPTDKFWARVSMQTVDSQQGTLSDACGAPGQHRDNNAGLVFIQLFGPKSVGDVPEKFSKLAKIARRAMLGQSLDGNVWFRNSRINELPDENEWIRANAVAEFEYDEINM